MAAGDVTESRLFGPTQPGLASGVLYTVPAARRTVLKQIVMANTTGAAATVTVGIGGAAAANQLVPTVTVAANEVYTFDCSIPLDATETLNAMQGTAAAITVTGAGFVVEI